MITSADFPNLRTPIWNSIRIRPRRTATDIGDAMAREAGFDPEIVRRPFAGRKATPPGLTELRWRIMLAMKREGITFRQAQAWFEFSIATLQDYYVDAKKLEANDA